MTTHNKRKMKSEEFDRKWLMIMSLVGIILIVNISGYNLYQKYFVYSEVGLGAFKISSNWTLPDYSKEAYVQINLMNESQLIYLECLNSTLVIDNNKIYCTKE